MNKLQKYIDVNHCLNHKFDEEWDICLVFLKYELVREGEKVYRGEVWQIPFYSSDKLTSFVMGHIEIRYLWTGWSRKENKITSGMFLPEGKESTTWVCALMESMETQVCWQGHLCRGSPGAGWEDNVSINFWGWPGMGHQNPRKVQRATWRGVLKPKWAEDCPRLVGGPLRRGRPEWRGGLLYLEVAYLRCQNPNKVFTWGRSWCGVLESTSRGANHT